MDTPKENRLSMYVSVEDVMKQNQTLWQPSAAIVTAYAALKAHIKAINGFSSAHISSTKGVTATKRNTRVAMVAKTIEIAGAVGAYASAKADSELFAKVDYLATDFTRARDTEVAGLCQGVFNTANPIVELLTDQSVSTDDLVDLQSKIDEYSGTIGKPRSARSNNRAAGTLMDVEFEATDKLLEEQLDRLIVKFKPSQPSFYNAYIIARKIVDHPGGRPGKNGNGANGHDTPPTPPPQ